jgi:hypothetical protein
MWCLDKLSSGQMYWRRDSSKVSFRCDVEVLEFVRDPEEELWMSKSHRGDLDVHLCNCRHRAAALAHDRFESAHRVVHETRRLGAMEKNDKINLN